MLEEIPLVERRGAEPDYHVVEDEGVGHDYHVLEDEGEGHDYEEETALTYEVPVQSGATPTPCETTPTPEEEEYSILHHK